MTVVVCCPLPSCPVSQCRCTLQGKSPSVCHACGCKQEVAQLHNHPSSSAGSSADKATAVGVTFQLATPGHTASPFIYASEPPPAYSSTHSLTHSGLHCVVIVSTVKTQCACTQLLSWQDICNQHVWPPMLLPQHPPSYQWLDPLSLCRACCALVPLPLAVLQLLPNWQWRLQPIAQDACLPIM